MPSETIVEGLERYKIGAKIRSLRQGKKLGLVQLGEHTDLSPALLSKIERGQMFPTLPTLLRIAMVFNVGLDHFFTESKDEPSVAIVRKAERVRLPDQPEKEPPTYYFESLDFPVTDNRVIDAFYAEFEHSAGASAPHSHEGPEFVFVLGGELAIDVDGREYVLRAGDAMTFDARYSHSYQAKGRASCSALVVLAA